MAETERDEFVVMSPDGREFARHKDYWATGAFEQHTNNDDAEITRLIVDSCRVR